MSVQVFVVMPRWRCGWVLPWAILLLLLGYEFLEEVESEDEKPMVSYLLATVEYAIHIFNLQSNDTNAYRLVHIVKSRREQVGTTSSGLMTCTCYEVRVRGMESYLGILVII